MTSYDPTDFRARDREREEENARKRVAALQTAEDLRWLMSSKRGRRIAARLLDAARVRQASFSTNAMQMAFNEGLRDYGRWMLDQLLELCPESYLELLKEQDDERNTSGNGPKHN